MEDMRDQSERLDSTGKYIGSQVAINNSPRKDKDGGGVPNHGK